MKLRNQYGQVAECASQTWETWGEIKMLLERDIARGLKGELSAILATQIGVGSRIIAKANLIFRPHLSSDIENQANPKCRFANMGNNAHRLMKMPKSQMPINYGRAVFVLQGNQTNAKAMWV